MQVRTISGSAWSMRTWLRPRRSDRGHQASDSRVDLDLGGHVREAPTLRECYPGLGGPDGGYLVTESEPIVNTKHVVADGKRTPGMYQVVLLRKPPRLSYEQWFEIWLGSHTQVAINTQSTFGYRQNVIVRLLTHVVPPYDAIIEEYFPAEAMTDPMVFYNAVGDEAKRKRHEKAMFDSVVRFIDFDKIDRIPMSEYTMKS